MTEKAKYSTLNAPGSAFEADQKVRRIMFTANTAAAKAGLALPVDGNVDHNGLVVAHLYSSTESRNDDLSIGIILADELFDGVHLTREQWVELRAAVDEMFATMDVLAKVPAP